MGRFDGDERVRVVLVQAVVLHEGPRAEPVCFDLVRRGLDQGPRALDVVLLRIGAESPVGGVGQLPDLHHGGGHGGGALPGLADRLGVRALREPRQSSQRGLAPAHDASASSAGGAGRPPSSSQRCSSGGSGCGLRWVPVRPKACASKAMPACAFRRSRSSFSAEVPSPRAGEKPRPKPCPGSSHVSWPR